MTEANRQPPTEANRQPSQAPKKTREQLEAELAQSRALVSEDLTALKEGAQEAISSAAESMREAKDAAVGSLKYAKDHAIESVSETVHDLGERAQRAGYATSDFVSTHALPLGLLGLGLGWLALSMSHERRRHAHDERGERPELEDWGRYLGGPRARRGAQLAGQHVQQLGHDAAEKLSQLREQASELGHDASERLADLGHHASELGHDAYRQVRRAGARSQEFAHANPLAVGAIALAAGVGVGLLLPSTVRENEWLGPTRDRLWSEAQRAGAKLNREVERKASELKQALT